MTDLENLSEVELDVLKELGNIGTGHAATSLSKLLNKDVFLSVPKVKIGEIKNLSSEFIGEVVAGVIIALQDLEEKTIRISIYYVSRKVGKKNLQAIYSVWKSWMRKCMRPQLWRSGTYCPLLFVMHQLILWTLYYSRPLRISQ